MDTTSKIAGAITPSKEKTAISKLNESVRCSENVNPNVSSPGSKFSNSPSIIKSAKSTKKSASRNPNPSHGSLASPSVKKKIRERKFVIAKKKLRDGGPIFSDSSDVACEKCKKGTGRSKCLCVAYENLRASEEEFFENRNEVEDEVFDKLKDFDLAFVKEGVKTPEISEGVETKMEGCDVLSEIRRENKDGVDEVVVSGGDMGVKRSRERLLEEAREAVPSLGSGRVMNLGKEFEELSMLKLGDYEKNDVVEDAKHDKESTDSSLNGQQQYPKGVETYVSSSSSFCPSDFPEIRELRP